MSLNGYRAISETIALLELYNQHFNNPKFREWEKIYKNTRKTMHGALLYILNFSIRK